MKRYIISITLLFSLVFLATGALCAKPAKSKKEDQTAEAIDAKWLKANYAKAEYMIPMRDGVKLYTAVFAPKDKIFTKQGEIL